MIVESEAKEQEEGTEAEPHDKKGCPALDHEDHDPVQGAQDTERHEYNDRK